ncbi:protein phosphatase 2C domain-containing protein [Chitinophagaceae bacterium LWZ2-11]
MQIYSVLQIGEYHLNHCDDYLIVNEIGSDKILCAVMDGCSMAPDSYFASTLVGKLLKKISKTKGYKELYGLEPSAANIDDYLKTILQDLFKELNIVKNQLVLDQKDLLTTLLILLIDKKTNEGIVLVIGDGLININGCITEFDQDNKPDYLGFHLNKDFDTWYNTQTQKVLFKNIKDISIATDGITMFTKVATGNTDKEIDAIDFMINNKADADKEDMLYLKLKALEHKHGLKPTDDLALIRILN